MLESEPLVVGGPGSSLGITRNVVTISPGAWGAEGTLDGGRSGDFKRKKEDFKRMIPVTHQGLILSSSQFRDWGSQK